MSKTTWDEKTEGREKKTKKKKKMYIRKGVRMGKKGKKKNWNRVGTFETRGEWICGEMKNPFFVENSR